MGRLADVEVPGDERRDTTTAFLLRALRWVRDQGIRAEQVMTDNGRAYRSRHASPEANFVCAKPRSSTVNTAPTRSRRGNGP